MDTRRTTKVCRIARSWTKVYLPGTALPSRTMTAVHEGIHGGKAAKGSGVYSTRPGCGLLASQARADCWQAPQPCYPRL